MAVAFFAGMLHVNEHGLAVWRKGNARHFTFFRAHQEAPDLFTDRVCAQHLIIALAFVFAGIAVLAVRLNPQATGSVETDTVRAVECIVRRNVG